MSKELWIDAQEELEAEYIEDGMDEQAAHELACDNAQARVIDKLGDAFDRWKDKAKEDGTYYNPLVPRG